MTDEYKAKLAKRIGERMLAIASDKARADCMGCSDSPFAAVAWRRTLPEAIQDDIEEMIVYIYHTT